MTLFWARLRALPAGVWAALGAAAAIFFLYLRGRRLEGEIAKLKVEGETARARAEVARLRGKAEVLTAAAEQKRVEILAVEATRAQLKELGAAERKKLAALSPGELDDAYRKLAQEKARDR